MKLWVTDLSLVLFTMYWGTNFIQKEWKHTAIILGIIYENQWDTLRWLQSRFMLSTCASSFIVSKLSLAEYS